MTSHSADFIDAALVLAVVEQRAMSTEDSVLVDSNLALETTNEVVVALNDSPPPFRVSSSNTSSTPRTLESDGQEKDWHFEEAIDHAIESLMDNELRVF